MIWALIGSWYYIWYSNLCEKEICNSLNFDNCLKIKINNILYLNGTPTLRKGALVFYPNRFQLVECLVYPPYCLSFSPSVNFFGFCKISKTTDDRTRMLQTQIDAVGKLLLVITFGLNRQLFCFIHSTYVYIHSALSHWQLTELPKRANRDRCIAYLVFSKGNNVWQSFVQVLYSLL